MKTKSFFCFFILLAFTFNIKAQTSFFTNLIIKKIPIVDTVVIDTAFCIVPNSLRIQADTSAYIFNSFSSELIWKIKPTVDSIEISYRRFPSNFSKRYFHKDLRKLQTNFAINNIEYDNIAANSSQPFVDFGNVNYAGSFGRTLSFGNNQDVVLNSQFNLQLDGDLGDSIKLLGAITDNTIPFQPDGNTQQIQEFDKLYLQLSKKKATLIAGDYELKKPNSYFMNFYKRVQGALVSNTFYSPKTGEHTITAAASLAKGKFVRNSITALEGNQGPYRLTGPNGEQFFVVLANTERVYIDGILQQRGEDMDYIIDYNSAEITFMPKRLITKDLRIVVEFEFSDRNYLNSLFFTNYEWQVNKKLQIRFNAFSNQDAKNQPILQSLDKTQKQFLATVGDNIQQAFYPSVRLQDTFSNSKILYKKIDTTVATNLYNNVYVFSTNPDSAKYLLSFSFVGTGNGNYKQAINTANGRVYEWVAPINTILQGDYEPVYMLVTPKQQQLFTIASNYQIDSNKTFQIETALSKYDPNLFSGIGNENHIGAATKIQYNEKRNVLKTYTLVSSLNYEIVNKKFKPIERFRNVEFARDWNIPTNTNTENEQLGNAFFSLQKSHKIKIDYQFANYIRGNDFKGFQHILSSLYQKNGYRVFAKGNYITQQSLQTQSQFFRPILEVEKQFKQLKNITIGSKFLLEHNAMQKKNTDSLLPASFSFDVTNIYLKNNTEAKNNFSFDYTLRRDRAKKINTFEQSTLGQTFALNTYLSSVENHEIKLVGAYRVLQISDTTLTPLKPDESLLGRLEYNFSIFKNVVSGNVLYELGSGQEIKKEFTYLEVPIGQGVYVWRDYNNDNLKQLNEFEIAIFPDEKKYIRVYTPTNQFVKAKYSQYNQSIIINPKNLFENNNEHWYVKVLSALYFQSSIQLNNRFIGTQGIEQYNPFIKNFKDDLLITNATNMVNSFFINRLNNTWGVDYIQTFITGKTLLNYGIDARKNTEHQIRIRYNINKHLTLGFAVRKGTKITQSAFLENKNYAITNQLAEPTLTWLLHKNQLRIITGFKYDVRQNAKQFGNEKSMANNIDLDMKYNLSNAGSVNAHFTFSSIAFNGLSSSSVSYAMLDGLQKGKNMLWLINFERRLSKSIEMSVQYEGRKSASNNVIHTGRATVRAVF